MQSVQDKEEKTEEIILKFAHSYLGIGWHDSLQIWHVDLPSSGAF